MKIFLFFTIFSIFLFAEEEAKPKTRTQICKIKKLYTYLSYGSQCSGWDEVMVGIQSTNPLVIKCATVQAECPNRKIATTERD